MHLYLLLLIHNYFKYTFNHLSRKANKPPQIITQIILVNKDNLKIGNSIRYYEKSTNMGYCCQGFLIKVRSEVATVIPFG